MFPYRFVPGLVAFSLGFIVLGCGGDGPLPITGSVKWESGEPISGATVLFVPASGGRPASGLTGADGSFQLSTKSHNDGAPPGDYKVVITRYDEKLPGGEGGGGDPKNPTEMMAKAAGPKAKFSKSGASTKSTLPKVYSTEKTTPLTWKVESGKTNPEFKLRKS
jgi:hypothetical protein